MSELNLCCGSFYNMHSQWDRIPKEINIGLGVRALNSLVVGGLSF